MSAHTNSRHLLSRSTNGYMRSRLALALCLTLGFVFVEAAAGLMANSLALLTDAAHNLTDVAALGLSWFALRLQVRPSGAENTYGYHRAGILVALINSATLVVIALGIFYEAYRRFRNPVEVQAQTLVLVGLAAVGLNLGTALLIRRGGEHDLNLRSAFVHLAGDVASTTGAVIAGAIIYFTGANWIDPLVSVMIGLLILFSAWGILREAVDILLELTPRDVNMKALVEDILGINGILGVHDLHVWSLTPDLRTMSAHLLTEDGRLSGGGQIRADVNDMLAERYNILHSTLQLECVGCDPSTLYCEIDTAEHAHAD